MLAIVPTPWGGVRSKRQFSLIWRSSITMDAVHAAHLVTYLDLGRGIRGRVLPELEGLFEIDVLNICRDEKH